MPKKIPMRRCVVTGERLPKKELLRIVRTPEGEVKADPTGKMNGRGAYLKKDKQAIEAARHSAALAKALETQIPETFWPEVERYLD